MDVKRNRQQQDSLNSIKRVTAKGESMKETLKRIKIDVILSAVICVAMGIVILVWPEETIDIVCKVLAIGLVVMGCVQLFSYITDRMNRQFTGILGMIVLLVGIWIFMRPQSVVSLIPIVIGVILAIHGVQDVKLALEARANRYDKWWSMLIIALVSLALGVLCIVKAFGVVTLATQLIGIALIYDGISDLWIVIKTLHAAKILKEEAEALDVEYKEVKEEE
jgi:uncharacterized membrane protein HdeD (DUF308 family)